MISLTALLALLVAMPAMPAMHLLLRGVSAVKICKAEGKAEGKTEGKAVLVRVTLLIFQAQIGSHLVTDLHGSYGSSNQISHVTNVANFTPFELLKIVKFTEKSFELQALNNDFVD